MKQKESRCCLNCKDCLFLMSLLLVMVVLRLLVFTPIQVHGMSMAPTLEDNQRLWGLKRSKLARFDIVSFPSPLNPKNNYIKRVIGMPGDAIEFREDELYINDQLVAEPYLAQLKAQKAAQVFLTENYSLEEDVNFSVIPEGKLFVMGDNRQRSFDGREFGLIDSSSVIAVARFTYWPPKAIGLTH